jgi:hypothetical protein
MSDLSKAIFHDETKAREWLEACLWPQGPICPKCGTIGEATLMQGGSHRSGLYQCNSCREPFTVTVGTLYEREKLGVNDAARMAKSVQGIVGKRLTYRPAH